MDELWPELEAVAMGDGLTKGPTDSAVRRRRLEVLLDRVSLLTTDTTSHLLDPSFAGAFTAADMELKREISHLLTELSDDHALVSSAEAFEEVQAMCAQLGLPIDLADLASYAPFDLADLAESAVDLAEWAGSQPPPQQTPNGEEDV